MVSKANKKFLGTQCATKITKPKSLCSCESRFKKFKKNCKNKLVTTTNFGLFYRLNNVTNFSTFNAKTDLSPFFNITFDKGRLKNLVSWTLQNYGHYKTVELLEQLKKTGFEYATKAGISLGIDDLKIPPKKNSLLLEAERLTRLTIHQYERADITAVERFQRLVDTWHRTSEQLKQEVINHFEETDILNPVYMMAFSGARGNISQVRQLVGMRGLMSDPQGQIIDFPIRSNFREGLTLTEYIISSYGARKGIVDTALRTANAGYLTRRLVDVAQHVIISHYDCGTHKGIFLTDMKEGNKTIVSAQSRIIGRVLARTIYKPNSTIKVAERNQEITTDLAFEITKVTNKIFVRSALTCNTTKLLCQLCYGWSLAQGNLVSVGEAVGVIAAQSIGEPGTQLTMRTFHTGGVFSGDVSDEIRAPYNGFVYYDHTIPGILIRALDGKVLFLTKSDGTLIFSPNSPLSNPSLRGLEIKGAHSTQKKFEIKKYKIPAYTILFFRNGESVSSKQVIAQITAITTNARETAELVIKSELEGSFYGKNLQIEKSVIGPNPKFTGELKQNILVNPKAMEIVVKARGWNFAWVLSGKRYETPFLLQKFPIIGDYITPNTVMTRHQLNLGNFVPKFNLSTLKSSNNIASHMPTGKTLSSFSQSQFNGVPHLTLKNYLTTPKPIQISAVGSSNALTLRRSLFFKFFPLLTKSMEKSNKNSKLTQKRQAVLKLNPRKLNRVLELKVTPTTSNQLVIDLANIKKTQSVIENTKVSIQQDLLFLPIEKIKYHRVGYFFKQNLLKNNTLFLNLTKPSQDPTSIQGFNSHSGPAQKFTYNFTINDLIFSPTGLKCSNQYLHSLTTHNKKTIALKRFKKSFNLFELIPNAPKAVVLENKNSLEETKLNLTEKITKASFIKSLSSTQIFAGAPSGSTRSSLRDGKQAHKTIPYLNNILDFVSSQYYLNSYKKIYKGITKRNKFLQKTTNTLNQAWPNCYYAQHNYVQTSIFKLWFNTQKTVKTSKIESAKRKYSSEDLKKRKFQLTMQQNLVKTLSTNKYLSNLKNKISYFVAPVKGEKSQFNFITGCLMNSLASDTAFNTTRTHVRVLDIKGAPPSVNKNTNKHLNTQKFKINFMKKARVIGFTSLNQTKSFDPKGTMWENISSGQIKSGAQTLANNSQNQLAFTSFNIKPKLTGLESDLKSNYTFYSKKKCTIFEYSKVNTNQPGTKQILKHFKVNNRVLDIKGAQGSNSKGLNVVPANNSMKSTHIFYKNLSNSKKLFLTKVLKTTLKFGQKKSNKTIQPLSSLKSTLPSSRRFTTKRLTNRNGATSYKTLRAFVKSHKLLKKASLRDKANTKYTYSSKKIKFMKAGLGMHFSLKNWLVIRKFMNHAGTSVANFNYLNKLTLKNIVKTKFNSWLKVRKKSIKTGKAQLKSNSKQVRLYKNKSLTHWRSIFNSILTKKTKSILTSNKSHLKTQYKLPTTLVKSLSQSLNKGSRRARSTDSLPLRFTQSKNVFNKNFKMFTNKFLLRQNHLSSLLEYYRSNVSFNNLNSTVVKFMTPFFVSYNFICPFGFRLNVNWPENKFSYILINSTKSKLYPIQHTLKTNSPIFSDQHLQSTHSSLFTKSLPNLFDRASRDTTSENRALKIKAESCATFHSVRVPHFSTFNPLRESKDCVPHFSTFNPLRESKDCVPHFSTFNPAYAESKDQSCATFYSVQSSSSMLSSDVLFTIERANLLRISKNYFGLNKQNVKSGTFKGGLFVEHLAYSLNSKVNHVTPPSKVALFKAESTNIKPLHNLEMLKELQKLEQNRIDIEKFKKNLVWIKNKKPRFLPTQPGMLDRVYNINQNLSIPKFNTAKVPACSSSNILSINFLLQKKFVKFTNNAQNQKQLPINTFYSKSSARARCSISLHSSNTLFIPKLLEPFNSNKTNINKQLYISINKESLSLIVKQNKDLKLLPKLPKITLNNVYKTTQQKFPLLNMMIPFSQRSTANGQFKLSKASDQSTIFQGRSVNSNRKVIENKITKNHHLALRDPLYARVSGDQSFKTMQTRKLVSYSQPFVFEMPLNLPSYSYTYTAKISNAQAYRYPNLGNIKTQNKKILLIAKQPCFNIGLYSNYKYKSLSVKHYFSTTQANLQNKSKTNNSQTLLNPQSGKFNSVLEIKGAPLRELHRVPHFTTFLSENLKIVCHISLRSILHTQNLKINRVPLAGAPLRELHRVPHFSTFLHTQNLKINPLRDYLNKNTTPVWPKHKLNYLSSLHYDRESRDLLAQTNYFSPFEGEISQARTSKKYLDLNPYENLQKGLQQLGNLNALPNPNSQAGANRNRKKNIEEKIRLEVFKYYLQTLHSQKNESRKDWSRLNLILTKKDLLTLNYTPRIKSVNALTPTDVSETTSNEYIKLNERELQITSLMQTELKHTTKVQTIAQINKLTHFNSIKNLKNKWLKQQLEYYFGYFDSQNLLNKTYQIKIKLPKNQKLTSNFQTSNAIFTNRSILKTNYKKFLTKNKVGFFFLKGNTFFNSALNINNKINSLTLSTEFAKNMRFVNMFLNLEVEKMHLQTNFLDLKPAFDKVMFTKLNIYLPFSFAESTKFKTAQHANYKQSSPILHLEPALFSNLNNNLRARSSHLNIRKEIAFKQKTSISTNPKRCLYYINSVEIGREFTIELAKFRTTKKIFYFVKPNFINRQGFVLTNLQTLSKENFMNEKCDLTEGKLLTCFGAHKVTKEIFSCMIQQKYLNTERKIHNSRTDSETFMPFYLTYLAFLVMCNHSSFMRNTKTIDRQILWHFAPLNRALQDELSNQSISFTETKKEPSFKVIKKSGQLIHMNNNKITLRLGQPLVISPHSIIHATHGDFIEYKTAVITLTYQQLKTGDIVQGIPKIEQLFEARTTKRGRLFKDNVTNLLTGLFLNYFVKSTYLLRKNMLDGLVVNNNKLFSSKKNLGANSLKHKSFKSKPISSDVSQFLNSKQNQTIILALALQWSVKQSFYKIQQIIVDGILRVYRSQGVSIADKHVEIIVKQMTSKVRIINSNASKMPDYSFSLQFIKQSLYQPETLIQDEPQVVKKLNTSKSSKLTPNKKSQRNVSEAALSQLSVKKTQAFENKLLEKLFSNKLDSPTGLFPGEIVDIDFVENINIFLLKTAKANPESNEQSLSTRKLVQPIKYEPIVLGITRASLEVDSFLSAASFQQTTRVLSQAALYKKKDFLKGLKENIIIGNLIPAGTGYLSSINF